MRKSLSFIPAIVAIVCVAQDNKTMFIHSDDTIDAFFFAEIDSIRYSNISIDSVPTGQICVQEIWTSDSVYRYDIVSIDSVTFQSPKTIARSGTIDLSKELAQYILEEKNSEEIKLKLSASTPSSMIPHQGDYLYQLTGSKVLPTGFAGRVMSVGKEPDGIGLICESADYDKIFEQLSWVGENSIMIDDVSPAVEKASTAPSQNSGRAMETQPALVTDLDYPNLIFGSITMDDELRDIPAGPEKAGINAHLAITPTLTCLSGAYILKNASGSPCKLRRVRTSVNSTVKGNISGRYYIGEKHTVQSDRKVSYSIPIGLGQTCSVVYNGNMSLSGKMGLDYIFESGYSSSVTTSVRYNDQWNVSIRTAFSHKPTTPQTNRLDASLDGELSLLATLTMSVVQSNDSLKSISNTYSYGSSLNGKAFFLKSQIPDAAEDNALYQTITATGVKVVPVNGITCTVKYSEAKNTVSAKPESISSETFYAVPKFSHPTWDDNSKTVTYSVEGSPMDFSRSLLGIAVKNPEGTFKWSTSDKIWPEQCLSEFSDVADFDSSSSDKIYPTVTLPTGERILAAPCYPPVTNNLYPVISAMEYNGVRLTAGSPVIGSASSGTSTVIVGNIFPFNNDDKNNKK